jgi:hypothetical protein
MPKHAHKQLYESRNSSSEPRVYQRIEFGVLYRKGCGGTLDTRGTRNSQEGALSVRTPVSVACEG